jgi:hypothetical protein
MAAMTQEINDGFDTKGSADGNDDPNAPIKGRRIKYGCASKPMEWVFTDDTPVPNIPFIAIKLLRAVQKWPPGDSKDRPETRILGPDEAFPDIDKLNANTPRSEWRKGPNGEEKGPYEAAVALYLLDSKTAKQYTFISPTVGAHRAAEDLRETVGWMRELKGERCYAEVELGRTHMPTQHGGRLRPDYVIKRYVTLGANGSGTLSKVDLPRLTAPQETEQPSEKKAAEDNKDDSSKKDEDNLPW